MNTRNYTCSTLFYRLGQLIGISAGAIAAMLWMLTLWIPDSSFSFNIGSMAVIFTMTILAVIAIVASLKGHAGVLIVIFGVSFFPIGLYVLGVPHWIQWVGFANMGYLMSAVIIWRFRVTPTGDKISPGPQE
jgi:hypothetical protein